MHSRAQWHMPVVPATQEAETHNHLSPGVIQTSLSNIAKLCLKNKIIKYSSIYIIYLISLYFSHDTYGFDIKSLTNLQPPLSLLNLACTQYHVPLLSPLGSSLPKVNLYPHFLKILFQASASHLKSRYFVSGS